MLKRVYIFLSFILIAISVNAQTFSGKVLDKNTLKPIPFAKVYLVDLKMGTITDQNGKFSFATRFINQQKEILFCLFKLLIIII